MSIIQRWENYQRMLAAKRLAALVERQARGKAI